MSVHLLYKLKQVDYFLFFIYYAASWYSFEISDCISYFNFINHFDFKSFGLILIKKFKFLLKINVYALFKKKYFCRLWREIPWPLHNLTNIALFPKLVLFNIQ